MPTRLSESVLHALIGEAGRDDDCPSIVAVAAAPEWSNDPEFMKDGRRVRVVPCVSPLAVRDVVSAHDSAGNGLLVLLTDLAEAEIGQEILARVWRHRLQRPSRWEALRQLFRVEEIDPQLVDNRWLVDLLVDVAPSRGYTPPPGGLLDIQTAWRTLLRHGLKIGVGSPTVTDLLQWGIADRARTALNGPAARYRDDIAERLAQDAGPVARYLLGLVADGKGHDLIPLGLICEVLWPGDDPTSQTARIRFETPVGTKGLSEETAISWATAAIEVLKEYRDRLEFDVVRGWVGRAEALLTQLEATELAHRSTILAQGFHQRLSSAGSILKNALETPSASLDRLGQILKQVQSHAEAESEMEEDRVRRLSMAVRLTRWLRQVTAEPVPGLETAAVAFVQDGCWVDAARDAVSHGERISSLADAYGQLLRAVDDKRRARDLAFAERLVEWSKVKPIGSKRLLPIERVLGEVVGPIASKVPVLVVVLDGFSYPDSIRLSSDLQRGGWSRNAPEDGTDAIVVAALPTVTAISRASLLSGILTEGNQDTERTGFTEHSALRTLGPKPPRLFHKKDLKIDEGRIAPEVHEFIADAECRVVGVVVNAIDDHLDKTAQLKLEEGLRGIRPLRPLLDAAVEAGRVVIVASDHGHVFENGSKMLQRSGAGERWRRTDSPAGEGEVELEGPRVVKGNGKIVAAAIETIRYIPMEKRGYHGGATPQEVLCPLLVLTPSNVSIPGWASSPVREPAWWSPAAAEVLAEVPVSDAHGPPMDADGHFLLTLDTKQRESQGPADTWVDRILASAVMEYQRELAGRQALDDDSLRAFLTALRANGGVAPPAVLADTLGLPPSRIRTKLEALRRMLNVEGYQVLTLERDVVRLNQKLLDTQFEVER